MTNLAANEEPKKHDRDHLARFAEGLSRIGNILQGLVGEEHGANVTDSDIGVAGDGWGVFCGAKDEHFEASDESVGKTLDQQKEQSC
jgi:hypothetical protein